MELFSVKDLLTLGGHTFILPKSLISLTMIEISQLKILLVDDHMLVQQYVRNVLQEFNITEISCCKDGNEAVDLIEKAHFVKKPFNVVFLDWNMPTVNGIGVLSYVRRKPEYDNMAIIMLTAESDMTNIIKAINMGATSYIVKPTTVAEIRKKLLEVHEWLKKKQRASMNIINKSE